MSPALPIKIVVGLGNPGLKYENTRHNLGFMALDRFASKLGIDFKRELKWNALVAKGAGVLFLKPQTFMNDSGRSVGQAMRFHKLEPSQVLVAYDDISLPLGSLRFRMKGSAGGHNGMKSIINHLGTEDFPRLKLGIGESGKGALVGHVLGKFSAEEAQEVENILATSTEALQVALPQGVEAAANQFNSSKQ